MARIIPAYYLIFPLVLLAIAASQGHSWSDQSWSTAVYATFSTNFVMAWHNALGSTWLGPVWTLAVEEQFYLIMPLLIVFLPRNLLPAALVGLTVSALLLRIALIGSHPLAAFALLPCRMDLLVCGVGAALLYRECDLTRHLLLLRLVPLIGLCLMLIVRLGIGNGAFLMSSNTIAGVAIAALILSLVLGAPEAAHYRNRVLCWFGKTSYCFYLVHQPVSGLLHGLLRNSTPDVGTPAAVAVTALAAAVSIALAALSWRLYEKPILSWAAERSERLRCRKLVVQPT